MVSTKYMKKHFFGYRKIINKMEGLIIPLEVIICVCARARVRVRVRMHIPLTSSYVNSSNGVRQVELWDELFATELPELLLLFFVINSRHVWQCIAAVLDRVRLAPF